MLVLFKVRVITILLTMIEYLAIAMYTHVQYVASNSSRVTIAFRVILFKYNVKWTTFIDKELPVVLYVKHVTHFW